MSPRVMFLGKKEEKRRILDVRVTYLPRRRCCGEVYVQNHILKPDLVILLPHFIKMF